MMIYGGEGGWSVVTGDTYGMRGGMVDGGYGWRKWEWRKPVFPAKRQKKSSV